jgi:putative NIF3 family GTP cyclohydrolase 1 type 2
VTAQELHEYLVSLVNTGIRDSVDRIVVGEPGTPVRKIGTCWQSYWETLKAADARGVNVVVTHEPTFYAHLDLRTRELPFPEQAEVKRKWILDRQMVVIRCHDMLDASQEPFGIPHAWGAALGFSPRDLAWSEKFLNVYRIAPAAAGEVAARLANRMKALGQPGVAFYGDPARAVATIGVGTGCYADPRKAARRPDLFVTIDDAISTWGQATYSRDTGYPIVVTDHGTSEEPGVRLLCEHLARKFPDIECIHFPQGCTFQWVSAR